MWHANALHELSGMGSVLEHISCILLTLTFGMWSDTKTLPCSVLAPFCSMPGLQPLSILCLHQSSGLFGMRCLSVEHLGEHSSYLLQHLHHLIVPHVSGPMPGPITSIVASIDFGT